MKLISGQDLVCRHRRKAKAKRASFPLGQISPGAAPFFDLSEWRNVKRIKPADGSCHDLCKQDESLAFVASRVGSGLNPDSDITLASLRGAGIPGGSVNHDQITQRIVFQGLFLLLARPGSISESAVVERRLCAREDGELRTAPVGRFRSIFGWVAQSGRAGFANAGKPVTSPRGAGSNPAPTAISAGRPPQGPRRPCTGTPAASPGG